MAVTKEKTLVEEYLEILKRFPFIEGGHSHMYGDSEGKITVGRGHLIKTVEDAVDLPFYSLKTTPGGGKEPPKQELVETDDAGIKQCFKNVQSQIPSNPAKKGAAAYADRRNNNCLLQQGAQDDIAVEDIQLKIDLNIKTYGKDVFDALPRLAQLSVLDIWYNTGHGFINMNTAIKNYDWSEAAFESRRATKNSKGVEQPGFYARNALIAAWLCELAEKTVIGTWRDTSLCNLLNPNSFYPAACRLAPNDSVFSCKDYSNSMSFMKNKQNKFYDFFKAGMLKNGWNTFRELYLELENYNKKTTLPKLKDLDKAYELYRADKWLIKTFKTLDTSRL